MPFADRLLQRAVARGAAALACRTLVCAALWLAAVPGLAAHGAASPPASVTSAGRATSHRAAPTGTKGAPGHLADAVVAVDSMGDAPWTSVPQVGMAGFRPHEAAWRRWLRAPGPLGWPLILLVAAGLLLGRRVARKPSRGAVGLLVVALALFGLTGGLVHRVVTQLLPPPPLLRGVVQRAPTVPAPGRWVIYAWGESTMHGDVWGPLLSIPKVIGWALNHRLGERALAVQNLAEPGTSLTRGYPAQLDPIFREPARYRAAALVVYVGHNAYYNLPRRWPDAEAERRHVEGLVTQHLRTLASRAEAAQVPVFIALPVSNIEGHPPMGPRHGVGVTAAQGRRYEALLDQAAGHVDPSAALAALDAAVALSPSHAWAHFARGRRLRTLGRVAEARAAFALAVELDFDRQRALPSHRAAIQRVCDTTWLRCVDAEAAMRGHATWLDDSVFIDIHHPVAAGHVAIGQAFAEAIAAHGSAPPPRRLDLRRPPPELDPRPATADRLLQTAGWYLVLAHELRAGYPRAQAAALTRASANLRVLRDALPRLAAGGADLAPSVAVLELLAAALRGDVADARRRWQDLRDGYDWRDARHPIPERWMRACIADVLGLAALDPPPGRSN